MEATKILLCLTCLSLAQGLEQVRYDNYKVYKVYVEDREQFELLNANEQALKVSILSSNCFPLHHFHSAAQQLAGGPSSGRVLGYYAAPRESGVLRAAAEESQHQLRYYDRQRAAVD